MKNKVVIMHNKNLLYSNIIKKIICLLFMLLFPSLCGFFALVGILHNPRHWKYYLPFFVLSTFFLAYAYVPGTSGCDLLRYFNSVEECARLESWVKVLSYRNDGCFVRNIIFWIIGKTGDVHLLPALSTATVYGVTSYISCSCASEYQQEKRIPLLLLLQLVLLPFSSVVDNVRNVCAFSLITLAAYLDIVKGKRNIGIILLYILPCFIHTSGIVLVVFRILVFFSKKRSVKIVAVISSILFPNVIDFAYDHIGLFSFQGNIGNVIRTGIGKAWNYYNTSGGLDEYEKALLASHAEPLYRLFEISFAVIILILIFYHAKRENKKWLRFNSYVFLICVMTLSCHIFITPHYWRFYCAVVLACPAILIPMLQKRNDFPKILRFLPYGLIVYGIGGVAINCWTLFHSVDGLTWMERILLSSPYTILIKFVQTFL